MQHDGGYGERITNATVIAAGGDHTCALLGDGGVECWGSKELDGLGDGATNSSPTPVAVSGVRKRT